MFNPKTIKFTILDDKKIILSNETAQVSFDGKDIKIVGGSRKDTSIMLDVLELAIVLRNLDIDVSTIGSLVKDYTFVKNVQLNDNIVSLKDFRKSDKVYNNIKIFIAIVKDLNLGLYINNKKNGKKFNKLVNAFNNDRSYKNFLAVKKYF